MLKHFIFNLNSSHVFCGQCKIICEHHLKSRIRIYAGTTAPKGEPILAICTKCKFKQIYFSQEFTRFSPPHSPNSIFKIVGFSRLKVNDWVYMPGDSFVGTIKSRFRLKDKEVYNIIREDGSETSYSTPVITDYAPHANLFFRLLPAYTYGTRIGDPIFHIHRNTFGKAVGLIYGKNDRLAVQLADNSIILLELPPAMQIAPNKTLIEEAQHALKTQLADEADGIALSANLGVLVAQGTCKYLSSISKLKNILAQIPGVRGVMDNIVVQPPERYSDEIITNQIKKLIWSYQNSVFNVKLKCENGNVEINALCRNETTRRELPDILEKTPGLITLSVNLRIKSEDEFEQRNKALKMAQNLRKNPALQGTQIRIAYLDNTATLEGLVTSASQKQAATLAAIWSNKNLKIINNISVIDHIQGNAYIKVA